MDAVCNSINNALGNDKACVGNPVGPSPTSATEITGKKMTGLFRAGWQMDYPLIQNFLQPLYYTDASSNDGKLLRTSDFDKLVNQANAETGTAKAVEKFQEAEEVVRDNMPAIPLWYQNGSAGYSDAAQRRSAQPVLRPGLHRPDQVVG